MCCTYRANFPTTWSRELGFTLSELVGDGWLIDSGKTHAPGFGSLSKTMASAKR